MAGRYRFPVEIEVEAPNLKDAIVSLHRRLGFDDDWKGKLPEVYGPDGNRIHVTLVRPAMLDSAVELLQYNPANCQQEPCCKGLLRFNHRPLCQLDEAERNLLATELSELVRAVRAHPQASAALDGFLAAPAASGAKGS